MNFSRVSILVSADRERICCKGNLRAVVAKEWVNADMDNIIKEIEIKARNFPRVIKPS